MRIYLDNCCFNRPYDDQNQFKIKIEIEAKLIIQEKIKNKELDLIWSFILDYENSRNIDKLKQHEIYQFEKYSKEYFFGYETTLGGAEILIKMGFKKMDALHLISAIQSKCNYFITTDKRILNKDELISEIKIINPVEFVILLGENK